MKRPTKDEIEDAATNVGGVLILISYGVAIFMVIIGLGYLVVTNFSTVGIIIGQAILVAVGVVGSIVAIMFGIGYIVALIQANRKKRR